ncbi:hypothetical protein C0J26_30755 [Pseudomonas baetica]|nr:hypothetical protein C0J26_30755 [Pseudomonas baetica]
MGASLLANAVGQAASMLTDTPSSRAGSLPQWNLRCVCADLQVNKTGLLRQMTDGRDGGCLLLSLRYTARPSAGTSGHFSYNQATQPAWLVVFDAPAGAQREEARR